MNPLDFDTRHHQDSSSAIQAETPALKKLLADPDHEQLDLHLGALGTSRDAAEVAGTASFNYGEQLRSEYASAMSKVHHWQAVSAPFPEGFPAHEQLAYALRDAEKVKAALDEHGARSKEAIRKDNQARRILGNSTAYLNRLLLSGTAIKYVAAPKLKGYANEIIANLDAQMKDVAKRPAPMQDVIDAAIAKGDAAAADAKPRVTYGKSPDLLFPVEPVAAEPSSLLRDAIPVAQRVDPWIWRFHRNELIADIKKQVAEHYAGKPEGMSEADKAKRIKALKAERLAADRVRCAKIWADFESGQSTDLVFPPDADVRAVLGIDGPEPERRD